MAHQPPLLTDKREGFPMLHQPYTSYSSSPCQGWACTCRRSSRHRRTPVQLLWVNLSPSSRCNQHQKPAARANRQHCTGSFSQECPDLTPNLHLVYNLGHFVTNNVLSSTAQSSRPLNAGFLHSYPFFKWKVQQLPHKVDFSCLVPSWNLCGSTSSAFVSFLL